MLKHVLAVVASLVMSIAAFASQLPSGSNGRLDNLSSPPAPVAPYYVDGSGVLHVFDGSGWQIWDWNAGAGVYQDGNGHYLAFEALVPVQPPYTHDWDTNLTGFTDGGKATNSG